MSVQVSCVQNVQRGTSDVGGLLGNRAFLAGKQVVAKKNTPRAAAYAPLKVSGRVWVHLTDNLNIRLLDKTL
eukprot:8030393-Pyramimonas_sp.AAC.3